MPKNIVITGGSRGIGRGLAAAFLTRDCTVTISGRSEESVGAAVQALAADHGDERVHGVVCDVTRPDDLEALWDGAATRFGPVDIWINNAGRGHGLKPLWELEPDVMTQVLAANALGVALGCRVAVTHMLAQEYGQIYNMEGFGSSGKVRAGMSVYAASKAAVRSLTRTLVEETQGTPVLVGSLSPGMVVTDLLLDPIEDDPEALERSKRIFNILADRVETVTPWLADQVLANRQHGVEIRWLTRSKIMKRFALAKFQKRDLFETPGT